jgi:hypothetical protein
LKASSYESSAIDFNNVARRDLLNRLQYRRNIVLHDRPVIVGHTDDGDLSASHVLLVRNRLIAGEEHIKPAFSPAVSNIPFFNSAQPSSAARLTSWPDRSLASGLGTF